MQLSPKKLPTRSVCETSAHLQFMNIGPMMARTIRSNWDSRGSDLCDSPPAAGRRPYSHLKRRILCKVSVKLLNGLLGLGEGGLVAHKK
jgi:hypothetical protein